MRRLLVTLITLVLATPMAHAQSRWSAGGDVGLLLRDEAGGNRTVLPSLSPMVSFRLTSRLLILSEYTFAYSPSTSAIANVSTQHHRLAAAVEVEMPVRRAVFVAGLGLAAALMHTSLADHEVERATSTTIRPAAWAFAGLEVPFQPLTVRVDVQYVAALDRQDWMPSVGVLVPFGGGR